MPAPSENYVNVIVFWALTYVTVSAYVPTFLAQHQKPGMQADTYFNGRFSLAFTFFVIVG